MMRCTTCLSVLVLIFLIAGLIWAGGQQAAQAEEIVNVYYAGLKDLVLPLFAEFEKTTGIHINAVRLSAAEAIDRLIAEKNNPQVDVLFAAAALASTQIKEKIFDPYTPPAYDVLDDRFKDPEGYWVGTGYVFLVFLSNKEFLNERHLDPPASWYALLDPAYTGMIQLPDPRTSGTALARVFTILKIFQRNEDRAFAYMKQLRAQVQMYTKSGSPGPVIRGQAGAGIFYIEEALMAQQEGYDVVISFPQEGIGAVTQTIALIQGARNPEAGRKLIDWATSPAMQNLYVKYKWNVFPVHPDARIEPGLAKLLEGANILPLDMVFFADNRERIIERWVKEVLP